MSSNAFASSTLVIFTRLRPNSLSKLLVMVKGQYCYAVNYFVTTRLQIVAKLPHNL
jgi:hypothetical protein